MINAPVPSATELRHPVGVFDGGVGSFDLVRRIRARYPQQDVIHLADRASFPYGAKTEKELLESVVRATRGLVEMGAESVVLASNAPSVTVLDGLRARAQVPVLGVKPPIAAALDALPPTALLAVAGAGVMIGSPALRAHIDAEAGGRANRVVPVVADELIALVEDGSFLRDGAVDGQVRAFLERLRVQFPALGGITLSSTHLPWLADAFVAAAPELAFFDPADDVVTAFEPLARAGGGRLLSVATASDAHPLAEYRAIVSHLGLDLDPVLVALPD